MLQSHPLEPYELLPLLLPVFTMKTIFCVECLHLMDYKTTTWPNNDLRVLGIDTIEPTISSYTRGLCQVFCLLPKVKGRNFEKVRLTYLDKDPVSLTDETSTRRFLTLSLFYRPRLPESNVEIGYLGRLHTWQSVKYYSRMSLRTLGLRWLPYFLEAVSTTQ